MASFKRWLTELIKSPSISAILLLPSCFHFDALVASFHALSPVAIPDGPDTATED